MKNSVLNLDWKTIRKEIRQHTDLMAFDKDTLVSYIVWFTQKMNEYDVLDELCALEQEWNDIRQETNIEKN